MMEWFQSQVFGGRRVQVMLAGRAAEEVLYVQPSTHALGDMVDATVLARRMVTNYGMNSELGMTTFRDTPTPMSHGNVFTSWKKLAAQLEGPDLSMLNAEKLPPAKEEMAAAYQVKSTSRAHSWSPVRTPPPPRPSPKPAELNYSITC
jgi:hypothetical protein